MFPGPLFVQREVISSKIEDTEFLCGMHEGLRPSIWFIRPIKLQPAQLRMLSRPGHRRRPMKFVLRLADIPIVDTGIAPSHAAVRVELPLRIAMAAEPVARSSRDSQPKRPAMRWPEAAQTSLISRYSNSRAYLRMTNASMAARAFCAALSRSKGGRGGRGPPHDQEKAAAPRCRGQNMPAVARLNAWPGKCDDGRKKTGGIP